MPGDPLPDIFPMGEPLPEFMLAMTIARNDIEHAQAQAWKARDEGDDSAFFYATRMIAGHLYEVLDALEGWRDAHPEVRNFLNGLQDPGRSAYKTVNGLRQQVGDQVLSHARNHTFHYVNPADAHGSVVSLRTAVEALGDRTVEVFADLGERRTRVTVANEVALTVAMLRHADPNHSEVKQRVAKTKAAAEAFVLLMDCALLAYVSRIDGSIGDAEPVP